MLVVTEAGLEELKRILDEHTDNAQAGLRLTTDQSGTLGLTIDVKSAEDEVLEHKGSQLLIIERNLSASLEGVTIDAEETPEGRKLMITKEASE
jgi:Fe-S cluster assembly iron-binding protein IscA